MGHSGFAIPFMAGAHKNGAAYSHLGLTSILEDEDPESIIQGIFRNSFNARNLRWHIVVGDTKDGKDTNR
jgi:hypothetical protein